MKFKERLEKFLELQNKNYSFEEISEELKISSSTLRSFLNKRGYKQIKGRYILKEENKIENIEDNLKQIDFDEIETKNKKALNNKKQNNSKAKTSTPLNNTKSEKVTEIKKINTKTKPKRDRKINITQDDLDKLCEVYDWYLEIKDNKSIKAKQNKSRKKDIIIEDTNINELKSTSIRVDKKVWEDFERLCSNSQYNKQQIITQALKDFMKEYKNLL